MYTRADLPSLIQFAQRLTSAALPGPSYYHAGDVAWQLYAVDASEDVRIWRDGDGRVAALAIFEHAAGWNHPLVLRALGGLAQVRRARGDAAEAERLLTRAIGVMDQSADALTVEARAQQAQLLTMLALVYRDQGRSAEADAAQARARSLSATP